MSRQLELQDLIGSLFTPEEFRSFLRQEPDSETILHSLPDSTSLTQVADASIEALIRRGLVDQRFFERLVEVRPGRARDIESTFRAWEKAELRPVRHETEWDFFIAYARPDRPLARELYDELKSQGCRAFLDLYDVVAGEIGDLAILEAQRQSLVTIVLLSSSTGKSFSQREAMATGQSLARDSRLRHWVIPVFLEDLDPADALDIVATLGGSGGENTLAGLQGLSIRKSGLQEVALRLQSGLETLDGAREPLLSVTDKILRDQARRFFHAAGREIKDGDRPSEFYVLPRGTKGKTCEPEPVEVCGEPRPSRVDVRALAPRLHPGLVGYFVHRGELPLDTEAALNTLRVQGHSIVPLGMPLMAASLQDDTAPGVLHTVAQQGRGGDNLFRTRNALVDRRFLFGRSELLARIGSALGRGEQILLTGTRKIGKTSFLNILRQDLDQPVAVIDLQRYDRTKPSWVEALLHEIVAAYDRWGANRYKDWPAVSPGGDQPTDTLEFERMLGERRRWQAERGPLSRLVIILDELERLLPRPGEGAVAHSFIRGAGALRALAQGGERLVSIIAADLRPTANRCNHLADGTNPFFEFFQEVPLPLLGRDSVDEMVRTIGRMMGVVDIERPFLKKLFGLSGGHPFVARTLAGAAYEQRKKQDILQLDDLREGITELDDDDVLGSFFDQNFWSPLEAEEQRLLIGAAAGELLTGSFPAEGTEPREGNPGVRASLKRQGLILRGKIPIAAFADWILRFHNLSGERAMIG